MLGVWCDIGDLRLVRVGGKQFLICVRTVMYVALKNFRSSSSRLGRIFTTKNRMTRLRYLVAIAVIGARPVLHAGLIDGWVSMTGT